MTDHTTDTCVCGHTREQHIYHEGACRPGFVCPEGCEQFRPVPHAIDTRAAETPVKIKVSQNTFWWLVDRSRERFGGDLDATILDLLQRVEGGRRDA